MTEHLTRALIALCTLLVWHSPAVFAAETPRQADYVVAVVNSEPITNSEVQTFRTALLQSLRSQGTVVPDADSLTRQALDELILEKALLQQAKEQGIRIDDDQIDQVQANAATSAGLTSAQFAQQIARSGMSLSTYRDKVRQQLTLQRLREREVDARIRVSDSEIQTYIQDHAVSLPGQLNLAMILIAVPENSTEAQRQVLQQRAQEVADRARRGENFAALAKAFSQASDKGLQGGEMGLRPAERYPELFANAVRDTPVQGIVGPVSSGAGFHILKVLDRQPGVTALMVVQTRARHILLRPSSQLSRDEAIRRLQQVRQDIVAGRRSFAGAAREISQDGSATQGGDLGWVMPGQFVPEFEEVMNRLAPGQISEPLVSRFGVHLLEVTERQRTPLSENDQREVARNAVRESRLEESYARWIEEVRGKAYVEMRDPAMIEPLPR